MCVGVDVDEDVDVDVVVDVGVVVETAIEFKYSNRVQETFLRRWFM